MAKLHGLKKNLNPECVEMAKAVEEQTKKQGINRFLGRRSLRKTIPTQVEEKNV